MRKLIQRLHDAGLGRKLFPEKDVVTHWHNGVGAFVPEIRKLVLYYDIPRIGAAGDHKGMVEFLHKSLVNMAKERPYVEFAVERRKNAPAEIIAHYMNGKIKRHLCYRLESSEVLRHANHLCDTSSMGAIAEVVKPEEANDDAAAAPPKRKRKHPRGERKNEITDLRLTGKTDWERSYYRHIRQIDWKTIGRPTDRRFPHPVLRSNPNTNPWRPWDPFTAPEKQSFRP